MRASTVSAAVSASNGVEERPRFRHVTDRDCPLRRGILQDSRPRPRTGGLLSPAPPSAQRGGGLPPMRSTYARVATTSAVVAASSAMRRRPHRSQLPPTAGVSTKKATQERSRLSADD